MSKSYSVVIEGAESVWQPAIFADYMSALRHAIRMAKNWKDVGGAPRMKIEGASYCGPLDVDTLLTMEVVIKNAGY
jgi:hypothetical protein